MFDGGTVMSRLNEIFGSNVFNDSVMKERLPKATYKALKKTIEDGKMTKDLALITTMENPVTLNTQDFISAIRQTLEGLL